MARAEARAPSTLGARLLRASLLLEASHLASSRPPPPALAKALSEPVPRRLLATPSNSWSEPATQLLSQGAVGDEVIGLWVSGATEVLCNGLYAEDAIHGGRPSYVSTADSVVYFDGWWKMNCLPNLDLHGWKYSSPLAPSDEGPVPPAGNWTTYGFNAAGDVNAPQVSVRRSHGNWEGPPPGEDVLPDVVDLEAFECSEEPVPGFDGVKTLCDSYLRFVRAEFEERQPQYILQDLRERENVDLSTGGSQGSGRSGQSFFITNEYVLKTMDLDDQLSFTNRVQSYTAHMMRTWATSTMLRVFALIRDAGDRVWILMNNWLPLYIHLSPRYDVKGSMYGRRNGFGRQSQLKDQDWVERGERAVIPGAVRWESTRAMNLDSSWLENVSLIDYSIIFAQGTFAFPPLDRDACTSAEAPMCVLGSGVPCFDAAYRPWRHDLQWAGMYRFFCDNETRLPKTYRGHSCVGSVYEEESLEVKFTLACYGIIDIAKVWDRVARLECVARGSCSPPYYDMSVKPPPEYRQRWIQFMEDGFFVEHPLTRGGHRRANPQRFLPSPPQCIAWGQALGITPGNPTAREKRVLCGEEPAEFEEPDTAVQLNEIPGAPHRSRANGGDGRASLALAAAGLLAVALRA